MCLRLFRNFVRIRFAKTRNEKLDPSRDSRPLFESSRLEEDPTETRIDAELGAKQVQSTQRTIADNKLVESIPWEELPFADVDLHTPEVIEIDPTKAFFSALPLELKLEIVDHIQVDFTVPLGRSAALEQKRVISCNLQTLRTLKALRLCSRECSLLGLKTLFATLNLTRLYRRKKQWLDRFDAMVPILGRYVRNVSITVDQEMGYFISRVFPRLPNIKWLLIDARHLMNLRPPYDTTGMIDTLTRLPNLKRITMFHIDSQPFQSEMNVALLKAHGSRLQSLDLHMDSYWSHQTNNAFRAIQEHVTSLENLYIYGSRGTILGGILVGENPVWQSRDTLKCAHFEECTELEAPVVTNMVKVFPQLTELVISSCGGPGDYGNANGRDAERQGIMHGLEPLKRRPLRSLRIVHATDIEFRYMSPIPTEKLIIFDPLDQLLLADLLRDPKSFPGFQVVELQYIKEPNGVEEEAFLGIKGAIERRMATVIDTRERHPGPRYGW